MPHNPNPALRIVDSLRMSLTASSAESYTFRRARSTLGARLEAARVLLVRVRVFVSVSIPASVVVTVAA